MRVEEFHSSWSYKFRVLRTFEHRVMKRQEDGIVAWSVFVIVITIKGDLHGLFDHTGGFTPHPVSFLDTKHSCTELVSVIRYGAVPVGSICKRWLYQFFVRSSIPSPMLNIGYSFRRIRLDWVMYSYLLTAWAIKLWFFSEKSSSPCN